MVVRTASGESRLPLGVGSWARSRGGFSNGIDRLLSVPQQPQLAAAAAWTADDVLTVKIIATETPFYSTLAFRFDGDRVVADGEHHVAFGPTKQPQLVGRAAAGQ
jgi:hypothetical protein